MNDETGSSGPSYAIGYRVSDEVKPTERAMNKLTQYVKYLLRSQHADGINVTLATVINGGTLVAYQIEGKSGEHRVAFFDADDRCKFDMIT